MTSQLAFTEPSLADLAKRWWENPDERAAISVILALDVPRSHAGAIVGRDDDVGRWLVTREPANTIRVKPWPS